MHPGSKSVAAAPTNAQLAGVLWGEVKSAAKKAAMHGRPLGGRFAGLTYELGEDWRIEGFGQGSIESKSGRHSEHLLALIDEASGVHPAVLEAIDSLNPSRRLYTGNPLRPEGRFYDLCESRSPNVNVIEISAFECPHVVGGYARSPWGAADLNFIDSARWEYGEDSVWWLVHVLGRFPDELSQALLPVDWLRAASLAKHERKGPTRLGVDISKGNDGDESGWLARDDNGVLGFECSRNWSIERTASEAARACKAHGILGNHVVYDAAGVGTDFGNRLRGLGIVGAKDYMGARDGGEKFCNLRAAAGWALRRRLDPNRQRHKPDPSRAPMVSYEPQPAFHIPGHLLQRYRAELQGLRYGLDDKGRIQLEVKADFVARLKKSPTLLDCMFMSFAYPNA
jgi:hypothetical protein